MRENMNLPVEVIRQSGQLHTAVQEMGNSRAIVVDTEANSRHRYPEQLCLIQLATPNKIFIVDTIQLGEIEPLRDILHDTSIIKVFHTAEYDIRSLNRHFGFQIHGVFDVAVAAQFIGITKFGLANLLTDLLGITIEKSTRLQKADWGKRPLSTEALEYAANDVRYLLGLREFLNVKLREFGRISWVTEECARLEELRYEPKDPNTIYLSVKGAGKLDGTSLSVLKALFLFREKVALRKRRPPQYIMPDSTLVHLAENPESDLSKTPGLGQAKLNQFGMGLQRALRKGLAKPPIYREKPERMGVKEQERLKRLKAWRASISTSLFLDPSLIWPTVSLERISIAPNTLDIELKSSDIRHWQRERFVSSLSILSKSL
jgi:ribonuclease D